MCAAERCEHGLRQTLSLTTPHGHVIDTSSKGFGELLLCYQLILINLITEGPSIVEDGQEGIYKAFCCGFRISRSSDREALRLFVHSTTKNSRAHIFFAPCLERSMLESMVENCSHGLYSPATHLLYVCSGNPPVTRNRTKKWKSACETCDSIPKKASLEKHNKQRLYGDTQAGS